MSAAGSEVRHPLFARFYQRFAAAAMEKGEREHRQEMLEGVCGRVIEVGAGHGLNFSLYPGTTTEVVAVEPEPILRRAAEKEAARAPVAIRVIDGVADALPAEDQSFDVGIASLALSQPGKTTPFLAVPRIAIGLKEVNLVSRVVTDLVAGAGLKFSERGSFELKGLPGRWDLFAASA